MRINTCRSLPRQFHSAETLAQKFPAGWAGAGGVFPADDGDDVHPLGAGIGRLTQQDSCRVQDGINQGELGG